MVADWPGLKQAQLYEGRDLKPTTDLRAVLKGLLRDHLRVDERALASTVFPDSTDVTPTAGLVGEIEEVSHEVTGHYPVARSFRHRLVSEVTTASASKMNGKCCQSSDGGRSYRYGMAMQRAAIPHTCSA